MHLQDKLSRQGGERIVQRMMMNLGLSSGPCLRISSAAQNLTFLSAHLTQGLTWLTVCFFRVITALLVRQGP